MNRIKLPGKEKTKKLILIILVIVAILVLIYQGSINKKEKNIKNSNESMQEENGISSSIDVQEKETVENNKLDIKNIDSAKESELYNEAYKLFFDKEYQSSITKADELINQFPNSFMGYNIRGIAKAYNGNYDEAIKDIDKSLELNKNYGYAKFNKALTYELYSNMDDALEWYNKALEDEEYVWSYYGIASIYGRRGDVPNTVIYLNKAINMDKAVKDIAKTEHDFDPVRNSDEFKAIVNN